MNQKALLAEVVGLNPNIFIDDEPTKGLDRDRISDFSVLLNKMSSNERGMLVITHDILLARNISDIVWLCMQVKSWRGERTRMFLPNPIIHIPDLC